MWGSVPGGYRNTINDNLVLILMIETLEGLKNADEIAKVPGVHAAARMEGEPFVMSIGGEEKRVAQDGPHYSALYEIDSPHVLVSQEWAKASEAGRWPGEVRPFTCNRRHALYKLR